MVKASPPTRIRSVRRAAALLEHIAGTPAGCTATAAADALDIPVPTAYHLLNTLVDAGLLGKDERRRYRLGGKVGLLAEAFLAQVSAPAYLVDRLRELADRTGETAYLSAWRGGDAVLLQIVEGRRAVRVSGLHLGYSGAAHVRASGKMLLAYGRPGTLDDYLRTHAVDAVGLRAEIEAAQAGRLRHRRGGVRRGRRLHRRAGRRRDDGRRHLGPGGALPQSPPGVDRRGGRRRRQRGRPADARCR